MTIGIQRTDQAKETLGPLTTKHHLVSCANTFTIYDPMPILD